MLMDWVMDRVICKPNREQHEWIDAPIGLIKKNIGISLITENGAG